MATSAKNHHDLYEGKAYSTKLSPDGTASHVCDSAINMWLVRDPVKKDRIVRRIFADLETRGERR
jgi:hypothetical protein